MEQRVGRQAETCPKHDTREDTSFGANAATSLGARSIFPRSIFQGSPPCGSSQPIRHLGMLGHARSAVGKEKGPWTRVGHPPHLPKCSTWNILSGYYCTYNKIWTLTAYETTETGYSTASATEDFPAAGFRGGGRRAAAAIAGEAARLQGDQGAGYGVSGSPPSGLGPK